MEQPIADREHNERREAVVAGIRRRGHVRLRRTNFGDVDGDDQIVEQQEVDGDEHAGLHSAIIGKKKMAKLEMKSAKKAAREQELLEREERRKREAEEEAEREKERERERLEEEAEQERAMKENEERKKREQKEYARIKQSFAVGEVGFDQVDSEEVDNHMRNVIDYVKECKVVNMDELASHFSLKTEEAIDCLKNFLANGELAGVMDDRGKFIHITEVEYAGVAKFINQRGRVNISELAEYSNRLIKLES